MNRICIIVAFFGLILFTIAGYAKPKTRESAADSILTKLLLAVENNDRGSFIADGDESFKAGITRPLFDGVTAAFAPRMKKGYDVVFLGTLNQKGCLVVLKKLVFKDGGDDVLAKLILRDGKIAGFWFQ